LFSIENEVTIFQLLSMETFTRTIQVRWSDMDANRHLRHSAYYDYGAAMRMMVLSDAGLTLKKLEELEIGPILFREEAIFKREIRMDDVITLDVVLVRATADYSRWSLRHNFTKADGTLAAVINIDGAWMNLIQRKLIVPDELTRSIFESFPKPADFEFIVRDKK
jgi:acyl-CoA thioester hydrolase